MDIRSGFNEDGIQICFFEHSVEIGVKDGFRELFRHRLCLLEFCVCPVSGNKVASGGRNHIVREGFCGKFEHIASTVAQPDYTHTDLFHFFFSIFLFSVLRMLYNIIPEKQ